MTAVILFAAAIVLFTAAYVLHQRRRKYRGRHTRKAVLEGLRTEMFGLPSHDPAFHTAARAWMSAREYQFVPWHQRSTAPNPVVEAYMAKWVAPENFIGHREGRDEVWEQFERGIMTPEQVREVYKLPPGRTVPNNINTNRLHFGVPEDLRRLLVDIDRQAAKDLFVDYLPLLTEDDDDELDRILTDRPSQRPAPPRPAIQFRSHPENIARAVARNRAAPARRAHLIPQSAEPISPAGHRWFIDHGFLAQPVDDGEAMAYTATWSSGNTSPPGSNPHAPGPAVFLSPGQSVLYRRELVLA